MRFRAGRADNQRNVQRRVVDKEPVRFFAMLTQAFAMISAQDDQGLVVKALRLEELQNSAYLGIGKSDLAVVWLRAELRVVRCGRLVGGVRIVQVHPEEKPLVGILTEPVERDAPPGARQRERLCVEPNK